MLHSKGKEAETGIAAVIREFFYSFHFPHEPNQLWHEKIYWAHPARIRVPPENVLNIPLFGTLQWSFRHQFCACTSQNAIRMPTRCSVHRPALGPPIPVSQSGSPGWANGFFYSSESICLDEKLLGETGALKISMLTSPLKALSRFITWGPEFEGIKNLPWDFPGGHG